MELLQVKGKGSSKLIYTFLLKGLVGQLQKRKSDIGFANLFVVPDRMKYIDYTDPYMIEYASFMLSKKKVFLNNLSRIIILLAKPPNPPQWFRILQPLQTSTWIGIPDKVFNFQLITLPFQHFLLQLFQHLYSYHSSVRPLLGTKILLLVSVAVSSCKKAIHE